MVSANKERTGHGSASHVTPPSPKVRALAEKLIGTTGDTEVLDEVNELTIEEAKQLDMLALECNGCGWWFHAHEMTAKGHQYLCEECS